MEKTIYRIRKGVYDGYPFSVCNSKGVWINNAESLKEINDYFRFEIRNNKVSIVKELHLYPEGMAPEYIVYGYARVSTRKQQSDGNSLEAQERLLKEAGAETIIKEAYTGKVTDRPEFTKLLNMLNGGDTLIVTKLDRFARTINEANDILNKLIERHIKVHVLNLGLIDNSPASKLTRAMFLAFAEFERDMIVERTQEGKAIARTKEGFKDGRPPKYSREQLNHALELLETHSYRQVVEMTGISKSTLIREKRNVSI